MAIKLYEKESLIKGFGLFFIVIQLFLFFIFYNYQKIEEEHLSEQLFLEMKNYSFFFDDDRFNMDIVPLKKTSKLYELQYESNNLYILVPMHQSKNDLVKIFYPVKEYNKLLDKLKSDIFWQFGFLSFIAILMSLLFSLYALHPLRNALLLLEEFIKDIIHDLNTPITSILINLKMMDSCDEEVKSISQSTKTISMLHKNLDSYLQNMKLKKEKFLFSEILEEQITFFSSMYDYLSWEVDIKDQIITTDKNALNRIIYNLLSNACKYNTSNGFISINMKNNIFCITNSSYGIKNPSKIFNRFYKESDRGIGIGLHIVEKLCDELGIKKELKIDGTVVTVCLEIPLKTLV